MTASSSTVSRTEGSPFITLTLRAPLPHILKAISNQPIGLMGEPKMFPEWESPDLPDHEVMHPKMGLGFPFRSLYKDILDVPRMWRLFQHLLGQSVRPSEAIGVLPYGSVAEVRVTALESVWRAIKGRLLEEHLFPSLQDQISHGLSPNGEGKAVAEQESNGG